MIEEHNPGIDFDWTRILKGGGEPQPERRAEPRPAPHNEAPVVAPPAELEGEEPAGEATPGEAVHPDEPLTATAARVGTEGLARLRGRYAEMMARIRARVPDPQTQEELKTLAERLNPDAWVTDEDVTAGLDGYESTFEALRSVVGQRRRRRRRRSPVDSARGEQPE